MMLILMSMLPAALRSRDIDYLSGLMVSMAFAWAYMINDLAKREGLRPQASSDLRREASVRMRVGLLFLMSLIAYFINVYLGHLFFALTAVLLLYRALVRWLRALNRLRPR